MRNQMLNIGVTIISFFSLPSCTTDPASEASEVSDVGLAENVASLSEQVGEPSSDVHALGMKSTEKSSSNENVRDDFTEDNTMASACRVTLNIFNDAHCYNIINGCDQVIHEQIVKPNGVTTACFSIRSNSILTDCLATGRVAGIRDC